MVVVLRPYATYLNKAMPVTTPRGILNEIHVTDRRIFKQCRNQYRFQILERLSTIADKVDALYIGTGGHAAMSSRYLSIMEGVQPEPMIQSFDAWIKDRELDRISRGLRSDKPSQEDRAMIMEILFGYEMHYADLDLTEWKILAVEQTYKCKIPGTNIWLIGTVDLVIWWKGQIWIVDHKFLRAAGDSLKGQLEMDDQMTAYLWLAKMNGIDAVGCIYNVIKKKAPVRPEPLVKGGLSKNKAIDTTYEIYYDAILEHGYDPEDYTDMLDMLKAKGNTFYVREPVRRNQMELDFFVRDLIAEAREMTSKNTYLYPSQGMQCGWCKYRALCKGEREGADIAFTRLHMYRVREDDER